MNGGNVFMYLFTSKFAQKSEMDYCFWSDQAFVRVSESFRMLQVTCGNANSTYIQLIQIIKLENYKSYNKRPKFDFPKLFSDILATKTLKLSISIVII